MARLDMAVEHGQTLAVAKANFETAINEARGQYPRWIQRVNWSVDRTMVDVAGPGFDVRLSYDDRKVYARGTIPLAVKLLEVPIQAFLSRVLK